MPNRPALCRDRITRRFIIRGTRSRPRRSGAARWIIERGGTWYWFYDSFGNDAVPLHALTSKDGVFWREVGPVFEADADLKGPRTIINPELYRLDDRRVVMAYTVSGVLRFAATRNMKTWSGRQGGRTEREEKSAMGAVVSAVTDTRELPSPGWRLVPPRLCHVARHSRDGIRSQPGRHPLRHQAAHSH